MGLWSFLNTGKWNAERLSDGSWFYTEKTYSAKYPDAKKLELVLKNPAALFLFTLLPDLATLGEWKLALKGNDKELESHPILDKLNKPNPMQTGNQFIWDYFFWRMLGTANLYLDSKVLTENNVFYFLSPDCIKWTKWFRENESTLFISKQSINDLKGKTINYETRSQKLTFRYENIIQFFDISNGINGWFNAPSRIDALYKVIGNSDNSLDSKNITSHLARKYMVSGKADVQNPSQPMMQASEQKSIEQDVMSKKNIHATRSMIDIKSFVSDAKVLESLDKAFLNDALIMAKVIKNIPKHAIELLADSTYENQEKGKASIISYCIEPAMQDFAHGILDYFGMSQTHELTRDYSNVPFVQVFEEQKASTMQKKADAMMKMVSAGVKPEDAAALLDWDIKEFNNPVRLIGSDNGENKRLKVI